MVIYQGMSSKRKINEMRAGTGGPDRNYAGNQSISQFEVTLRHYSLWKQSPLGILLTSPTILYLLSAKSVLFPTSMMMTSLPLSVLTSSIHFEVCWNELRSGKRETFLYKQAGCDHQIISTRFHCNNVHQVAIPYIKRF